MAIGVKAGSFTKSGNTTVPHTVTPISALAFQPKGMIVMGLASGSGLTTIERPFLGFAAGTGTTTQNASVAWNTDNALPTNTYRRASNAYCISQGSTTASTARASNFVWSGGAGSVDFTYEGANDTGTQPIYYWVFGGADITNVKVGTFNMQTTTGNQDITDVGFEPDFVFFAGADTADLTNANSDHAVWFLGAAKNSAAQNVMTFSSRNALSTTDTGRYQRTDKCIAFFTAGAAITSGGTTEIAAEADYVGTVATGSKGFRINVTKAPPASRSVIYMAIKGGTWNTGFIAQPTAIGTQSTTGLGHTPKGVFMRTYSNTAQITEVNDARWSVGGADAPTSQWALTGGAENNHTAIPVSFRGQLTTDIIRTANGPDAATNVTATADLVSLDSANNGGFTLNWDPVDATTRQILYVTAGDGAIVTAAATPESVGITETVSASMQLRNTGGTEQVGITETVYSDVEASFSVATDEVRITESVTVARQMLVDTVPTEPVGITETVASLVKTPILVDTIPTDTIGITETVHIQIEVSQLITGSYLELRFSGGANNLDPALSLGGEKSMGAGTTIQGDFYPGTDFSPTSDFYRAGDIPGAPGIITTTLFGHVTKAESTASGGTSSYRCIYVHNAHSTKPMYDIRIYVDQNTPAADHIRIGVGTAGVNETEPAITNQYTPPEAVEFFDAQGPENAIPVGDLPNNGGHRPIWIERFVPFNTTAIANNNYILRATLISDHD